MYICGMEKRFNTEGIDLSHVLIGGILLRRLRINKHELLVLFIYHSGKASFTVRELNSLFRGMGARVQTILQYGLSEGLIMKIGETFSRAHVYGLSIDGIQYAKRMEGEIRSILDSL